MKQSLRRLWKVKFGRTKLTTVWTCQSISLPLSMKIPLPAALFLNIRSSLMRKQAIESGNTILFIKQCFFKVKMLTPLLYQNNLDILFITHFSRHIFLSAHTNNQYESQIFSTIFCLFTFFFWVLRLKYTKNANITVYR